MNTAMDDGRQESPGEQTLSFRPVGDDDASDGAEAVHGDGRPEDGRATRDGPPDAAEPTAEGASASEAPASASEALAAGGATASEELAAHGAAAAEEASAPAPASEVGDDSAGSGEQPDPEKPSLFTAKTPARKPTAAAERDPSGKLVAGASQAVSGRAAAAAERDASGKRTATPGRTSPAAAEGDASGKRTASAGQGGAGRPAADAAEAERPSLFVRPAALGGPEGQRRRPAQDAPAAPDSRDEAEGEPPVEAAAAPARRGTPEGRAGSRTPEAPAESAVRPEAAEDSGELESADEQPSAADGQPSDTDPPNAQEPQAVEQPSEESSSGPEPRDEKQPRDAEGRAEELPAAAAETLMTALDMLRESVADLRFGLDLPGVEEARQAQADLLAQLEDYVLPRVRTSAAPALIVIAGSTGAGKSTLVNSLAEKNVSRTGVRRPTTGTPVLACHPDDRKWFAEGELLGGLERLDKPAPEAGMRSMVVVATEKLPQGVALLDTPDIDSVVEEHHEVAHRMLDAADLWIFVTTAARYADAPAWNLLRLAKERGARLAIVLSRVQPKSADVVLKHFVRMLTEYGLGEIDRFIINEAKVTDGKLPDSEVLDLRLWLAELSVDEERRAQAVRETLNGVLDSFRTRVPALARHLEGQVAFRAELRGDVEAAFLGALSQIDKASKNGSLLHGEVLARWQDFAGSGDLMRSLQLRKRGRAAKHAPERVLAFKAAIRAGLESVIVAAANRAAEEVVARWRHRAELGGTLGQGLERPSDNLVRLTSRAIASWQEHLSELVRTEGVAKRSVSKLVSFDPDSLALIFTVAMFSGGNGEGVPHRLVNALLGAESLRGIGAKALSDLRARIGMLFDEESMRYVQALDSAGIPDESVATRLYQATYNLEVAR
ncbi:dynamin family protein [Nonomuraea sp. M3C6]|uniref:Dynamin family protein n=1 Tax=Nonomuraea marmarensis TaxID=3351344 RepID=A0ABW7AFY8_9ACTN